MREDWDYRKIGDFLKTGAGGTPLKRHKEFYEGGNIPWLLSGEVGKKEIICAENYITEEGLNNSSAKLFPKNTVLVAMYGATAGETGILRFEATTNQAVCGILPNTKIISEFLYFCLLSKKDELIAQATGNAQPNISQIKIKNTEIPIPPLPEQQRIVEILDEAFEAIDQAKANVERNIQNAEELFQSKLNEVFSQRGEGWEETTLGKMCSVLNGYAFKSKEAIDSSNTQLLRMGNLYQNNLDLERRPVFYPDSYAEEYEKFVLSEGDLIMSLTGTVDKRDYGYTVEIPETDVTLLLNQRIMKIIIDKPDLINKSFLKGYLLSPFFLDKLYGTASGTRQANLSSQKIMKLPFYYPTDIEAQKKIVRVIQSLKEVTNSIVLNNKKRLSDIEELKKSILQEAFSGALTGGEPGFAGLQDAQDGMVTKAAEPEVEYNAEG